MMDALYDRWARNLRREMDARGLTQKQLAQVARMHQPTIQRLLARRRRPGIVCAVKIGRALGMENPFDLFTEDAT